MESGKSKRLFISMSMDGTSLSEPISYIKREYGLRTINPSTAHITILFIGDYLVERIPALENAIAEHICGISAFPYEIRGVGKFPKKGAPRVLWAGVFGEGFQKLHEAASNALGKKPEVLVPHITLCRIRKPLDPSDFLAEFDDAFFGKEVCNSIQLMESTLNKDGARHKLVRNFQL